MGSVSQRSLFARGVALAVVSLGIALWFKHGDSAALASLGPAASPDFVQREQKIHGHSLLTHFVMFMALGALYIALIDLLAGLVGRLRKGGQ